MSNIRLSHVGKQYDHGKSILEDFNLEIQSYEFLVLVGPSGCGKTTTLRLIAGLEALTSGEIFIGEQRVNNFSPGKRDIAMVFQDYALYPNMSVYDNMAFGLKNRKVTKKEIQEKIDQVAKRLEIELFLRRKPRALSGGQRQRVALGRAMVRESSIFLFDEPLSNLDAQLRANMRVEISLLHQELKATFVYVTHDQTEAMTMADRIAIMKDGKLLQIGTPEEIYYTPNCEFVAGFIGSPRMNFFHGKCTLQNGIEGIQIDSFFLPVPHFNHDVSSVLVGVRPENLSAVNPGEKALCGTVRYVEKTGVENYVHIHIKEETIILRSSLTDFVPSSHIGISFSLEDAHFFSAETGERLDYHCQ